jgi:hypothetical protein
VTRDYEPCYDPDSLDDETEHHFDADLEGFSVDWVNFMELERENYEDSDQEQVLDVAMQLLLE